MKAEKTGNIKDKRVCWMQDQRRVVLLMMGVLHACVGKEPGEITRLVTVEKGDN